MDPAASIARGLLFAYLRGSSVMTGDAVLMWVYDESRVLYARAVRDDRDMAALLDWWEAVGRFISP